MKPSFAPFRMPARLLFALLWLGFGFSLVSGQAPKPELSERTASRLGQIKALADAGNHAGILAVVDGLLGSATPGSFDQALLSQLRGQVLINENRHAEAVASLEQALLLGDRHAFFDTATTLNLLHTLSQLYFQQATATESPADRRRLFSLAYERIRRWIELSPRPTADAQLYAASILYNDATLDPAQTDLAKIRRALDTARTGLLLSPRPDEQSLVLIVAAQQHLGLLRDSADTLELLVERNPSQALYWQQLLSTYSGLASDPDTLPREARRWHLRALLTIERAQAHGHLSGSQDQFNIVALHTTLRQFRHAARLLEKGLAAGTIASNRRNWELLSSAWQQQREHARAIEALRQASQALPDDGEIELSLARLLYAQERLPEACDHLRNAVSRGNLEQPGRAWFFLAYVAYELRRFEDAARWAAAAAAQPDAQKEDVARLSRAISDALQEKPSTGV